MTKENFIKKINNKFPNEKVEVIYAGKNSYEKTKIKCLKCNSLYEFNTGEIFRARRKFLCKECNKIIKINPTNFLRNGLCPNCNSFSSIGEEKIASFLKKKIFFLKDKNILKSGI